MLGLIPMLVHKRPELLPIPNSSTPVARRSGFRLDISGFGFTLAPQVDRVATDIEQLARFTFLESVQLNRLYDFSPEIFAIGFSHFKGRRCRGNLYSLRPNLPG